MSSWWTLTGRQKSVQHEDMAITTLNCTDIGIDVNNYTVCMPPTEPSKTQSSCLPAKIRIPFGWRRELIEGRIIYLSPTQCQFASIEEVANYLSVEGTCKCGLECPFLIDDVFNFDPCVQSKEYDVEEVVNDTRTKLCNHKRKNVALAQYKQHSDALVAHQQQENANKLIDSSFGSKHVSLGAENVRNGANREEHALNNNNRHECLEVITNKLANDANDSVSVIHANQTLEKQVNFIEEGRLDCNSVHNCLLPHGMQNETICHAGKNIASSQFMQQTTCTNHCAYGPLGVDSNTRHSSGSHSMLQIRSSNNENISNEHHFCLYEDNPATGVYSFAGCQPAHVSVQQKASTCPQMASTCPQIYLTPQNTNSYGSVLSYENPSVSNLNLIQSSHQTFTQETFNHHFNHDSCCTPNVQTAIPLMNNTQPYMPLQSAGHNVVSPNSANAGAIAFSAASLPSNAINLNTTYPAAPHDHPQHHLQNNISILPQNPPMPPLSVPNVTTVTTSVTEVIPAVGLGPQFINSANPAGAPQVLQFINSVPLTQISANTVTVLQQTPSAEVPGTTLLIPQIMPHEHSMVINHTMGPSTAAMFPHIATATGLTALPNAFPNLGIASANISLTQRNCVASNAETCKPTSRTRKRREYNRTNRSHPPTVASILKQAAANEKKQQELKQEQQKQSNCQTDDSIFSVDSSQKEMLRSVAVQSEEVTSDSDSPVSLLCTSSEKEVNDTRLQTDDCNDSSPDDKNISQKMDVGCIHTENALIDESSDHSSPSSECFHGNGSDSGVESESTGTPTSGNCEEPDSQQNADSSRQRSMKRLKRLRKELSVYYGNENSDDESPQSPPLPPQSRTFNVGDLVWGQMGDVRFWPGKLVGDEELVALSLKKEEGKLLVKWFGDNTFTQVEPENLKTLSEGLEEHHCARKRYRSGKRMNSFLEHAIQEAMLELDRQSVDFEEVPSSNKSINECSSSVVTSTQTSD